MGIVAVSFVPEMIIQSGLKNLSVSNHFAIHQAM